MGTGAGAGGGVESRGSTTTTSAPADPQAALQAWSRLVSRYSRASLAPSENSPASAFTATSVKTVAEYKQILNKIRNTIIAFPLPDDSHKMASGASYRSLVWKLLLDISTTPVAPYLELVSKGKSPAHDKIRNDTFRTLATDQGFKERVKEEKLIRLLEAFVWKYCGSDDLQLVYDFTYVQGMNVLAAPFLYTLPSELEAFYAFSRFIETCCPLYVQPTLAGVHKGLQLLDRCLERLDPSLYTHLRSKNLSAEIYAFPSVLTLCACTPPLPEVLQLWDFLLAFGVHFNVLCIVAQLHIMRSELLDSTSPMKLLRHFPPLNARQIIQVTVSMARDVPEGLYEELVKHPYHPDSVAGML